MGDLKGSENRARLFAVAQRQDEPAVDSGQQIGQILIAVEMDRIVVFTSDIGWIDEEKGMLAIVSADAVQGIQAFHVDLLQPPVSVEESLLYSGQIQARGPRHDRPITPAIPSHNSGHLAFPRMPGAEGSSTGQRAECR